MIQKMGGISAILCLAWTLTATAQDPAAEAVPSEEPASEAAADATAETTPEAVAETPAEPAAAEAEAEAPADGSASESAEAAAEPREPWKLYAGIDQDKLRLSLSDSAVAASLGGSELDSSMLRLRAGMRFFDLVGIELQLGSGTGDDAPGNFDVGSYAGVFVVPTGLLFDMVEVAGMLGITRLEAERGGASESLNGQAYGVNLELPLRALSEGLPDLRIGVGHIVFNAKNAYRTYGFHFGLRYDFQW